MPEREKVIEGLECCVEKLDTVVNKSHGFNCIVCPYFCKCDRSGYFIGLPLMRDALALLKAQEPRVMTFDEVKRHYNLPSVFVDDLDMQEDYYQDIQPLYFDFPNPTPWDVHWRNSDKVRTYLDKWEDRYNKTWRCWTSRPDEKRREETPWEQ